MQTQVKTEERIAVLTIQKWRIMNLKRFELKNHYYFDVIISMTQLNLKTLILIISNR